MDHGRISLCAKFQPKRTWRTNFQCAASCRGGWVVKAYDQCDHRELEPTRILIEDKVYRPFLTSTMSYIDQFLTNNQNPRWFKFTMIALVVRFNDESNHREIQFSRNRNWAFTYSKDYCISET